MLIVRKKTFSCLVTLLDAAFRAACPTVKDLTPSPTSGETSVKSTHASFPPTHQYTITSPSLSDDLLSSRSVEKFTDASFFADTPAPSEYTKKHIPNKVTYVRKAGKLLTMNGMLPKSIQARLTTNRAHLINRK